MEEVYVGETSDFDDDRRRTVRVGGRRVVVFRHRDRYHALHATCLHTGGPLEDGMITPRVETVVDDTGRAVCDRLSDDEFHLVCPWHGWEYDIDTGEFAGDRRRRIRRYDTRIDGRAVYITASSQE